MPYSGEQLSDIESIRNVARRYCHYLDRLDAEGMRGVYWPDAVDDHGLEYWGYVDVAMESHKRWNPSLHTLLNHLVELDPGGVSARSEIYVIAYLFEAARPVLHTWFGRYLDRYEKRGDEWRIAERVCVHEGSRTDDPLVRIPFPQDSFRQGSFDRPSVARPIGP
jgi:SnoaL-like domain